VQFLTGHYWALFDGHGGPAAAILAANTLHSCLRRQLEAVVEGVVASQPPMHLSGRCVCLSDPQFVEEKGIRTEDLVIGALENAFQECVSVAFVGRETEFFAPRYPRIWGIPVHQSHQVLGLGRQDWVGLFITNHHHHHLQPSHLSST
jgi:hypothetical protein